LHRNGPARSQTIPHDGEMWVAIGLSNDGARAYRLCPMRIFNGTPTNYRDKAAAPNTQRKPATIPMAFTTA